MKILEVSSETIDWLLEESNPAIRYYTLTEILDKNESDGDVLEAKKKIPSVGWAKENLQSQILNTYWENSESCYLPKFTATVWRLIVLADLGVPGEDERIRRACEHFLKLHSVDGAGFKIGGAAAWQGDPHVCMTGNMVRTLIRFGYKNDKRVVSAIDWLLANRQDDGGWDCDNKGGRGHSSFSSTIQPLWALTEVSPKTSEISSAIDKATEFLLRHKLYKSDRTNTPIMLDWMKFHYPLHYRYDILHALRVLTGAGVVKDPRLEEAIELLILKAREGGRWILDAVPRGWHIPEPWHSGDAAWRPEEREVIERGWGDGRTLQLEEAGKPSKMITLNAQRVLKRMGKLSLPSAST